MDGTYEVMLGSGAVGTVELRREGLYYRVACRCRLSGDTVCKLAAVCDGRQESLGVLIPMGSGFGLETKIPAKRLGKGKVEFQVVPNRVLLEGRFVPISPEEPFAYIERLKDAYLARRNGQVGAVIRE